MESIVGPPALQEQSTQYSKTFTNDVQQNDYALASKTALNK